MENSFTVVRDDDGSNEEWSSFCSSCKSILQATYRVGESSFLNNDDIKKTELNQEFDEKENSILLNTLEYNDTLRNLMSLERSQNKTNYNTRKNILDHHRKIVNLTKSILHLRYAFELIFRSNNLGNF